MNTNGENVMNIHEYEIAQYMNIHTGHIYATVDYTMNWLKYLSYTN